MLISIFVVIVSVKTLMKTDKAEISMFSVNEKQKNFTSRWCVYFKKMKTNKVCLTFFACKCFSH